MKTILILVTDTVHVIFKEGEICLILDLLVVLTSELCLGHNHWMLVMFP